MAIHDDSIDSVEMFKVALQSGINLFTDWRLRWKKK